MDKIKRYKKISEFITDISEVKNKVEARGRFMGFKSLEPYISFIEGAITTVYGTAGSGKTQITIEACIHQAETYGTKTIYYLTEAGSWSETVLDICQTYLQKPLHEIEDEELMSALAWMDEFIFVFDISKGLMSIREIYEQVLDMQKEYGIKINNIVVDHFGNILPDQTLRGSSIADTVKFTFQAMTATSKLYKFHTIILFHVSQQDPIKCTVSGKFYLPKAEPYMLSGGVQSHFLSQQMISVYRPITREEQVGIINPQTGMPFELNEMHVTCMKVKPKQSGKLGGSIIHFDTSKQSYYEIIEGVKYYRGGFDKRNTPIKNSVMRPNLDFGKQIDMPDSAPF